MNTMIKHSLLSFVEPALGYVEDVQLKKALLDALDNQKNSLATIESFFEGVSSRKWTQDNFKLFFNAWKETHLKMLAIYGLSCRIQRLALETKDSKIQHELLYAAAKNAETSYEDLGIDYDGETHTQLYHNLAESFVSDDSWMLSANQLKEAKEFKEFIYRNMVVEQEIQVGLFTNMFSEIYNHAEYSIANVAFGELIDTQFDFTPEQKEKATTYIFAHIEDETELNHFTVVIDSLNHYTRATQNSINYSLAQQTFENYLVKLAHVFSNLERKLS